MTEDWTIKVFKQKSLWEVYRLSRRTLPPSIWNRRSVRIIGLIMLFVFLMGIFFAPDNFTHKNALNLLQTISQQAFVLAVGILGFLIAGFSIFASVTKSRLFIMLAEIQYENTEINRLQFVFFNFLNVFTIYFGLLAASLFLFIGAADDSPLLIVAMPYFTEFSKLSTMLLSLINFLLIMLVVISILRLKSFIWNLYQAVLVSIAANNEIKKREEDL